MAGPVLRFLVPWQADTSVSRLVTRMIEIDVEQGRLESAHMENLSRIREQPVPDFARYRPDLGVIERAVAPYVGCQNVVVVGSGGARTSFHAFYTALGADASQQRVHILTTIDPDRIIAIKRLCSPDDTAVAVISKSGTTVTALEALFAFEEYRRLVVTSPEENPLRRIAAERGLACVDYPPFEEYPRLDDRCSGFTASALVPAALVGLDLRGLCAGAETMWERCAPHVALPDNPALLLSAAMYALDTLGYHELFAAFYSSRLAGFLPLLIQLIHETSCKDGKGQTVFGDEGPECQHHTNQRLFGGRQNVAGLFFRVERPTYGGVKVTVPEELASLPLRTGTLGDLDGLSYAKALRYEFEGTALDAEQHGIPVLKVIVDRVNARNVGELTALLQYVGVYSALLRGVEPFGQPQVERSKEISFELRRSSRR